VSGSLIRHDQGAVFYIPEAPQEILEAPQEILEAPQEILEAPQKILEAPQEFLEAGFQRVNIEKANSENRTT